MLVGSKKMVDDFYQNALGEGHEGIMLKDPEAVYSFRRSKAVLKMKPFNTWDGEIVSWESGEATGKWKDHFGAFRVRFKKDGPITSVAGGFTDAQRLEFTENLTTDPHYYDGKIVEVKGQEMTKDGVVRFPVLVRFRLDK